MFAICTAAYPLDDAIAAAFAEGVLDATSGRGPVHLLLAVEAGYDLPPVLDRVAGRVAMTAIPAPAGVQGAALRRFMIERAKELPVEALIFADFDDRLMPDALDLHAAALTKAEISYGDMDLIDGGGRPLGRTFFSGARIPDTVEKTEALLDRNFMGFTNTAVRHSALRDEACQIPDEAVAADWWFFTMLLAAGACARRTAAPVTRYRIHDGSMLGSGPARSAAALRRRIDIAAAHYACLPEFDGVAERRQATRILLRRIEQEPEVCFAQAARQGEGGVWFDDVTHVRDCAEAAA